MLETMGDSSRTKRRRFSMAAVTVLVIFIVYSRPSSGLLINSPTRRPLSTSSSLSSSSSSPLLLSSPLQQRSHRIPISIQRTTRNPRISISRKATIDNNHNGGAIEGTLRLRLKRRIKSIFSVRDDISQTDYVAEEETINGSHLPSKVDVISSTSANTDEDDDTSVVSSSSSSSSSSTSPSDVLPSYKSLIVFTATTILIWLSEPLLSLVDTTIVGLTTASSQAVLQIAALGPATTLYDSAIYMTYFLAISTTNQLAPKLADKDWKGLRRSTSHLMGLALLFGCIVTAITFGFGRQLITQMVGTGMNSEIIPLATNYAKIRAIVSPFCVVGFVAQSFCLTILDTTTPGIAVAVASIVNVIGDLALSPRWGIQGAAVATALATVASCVVLVNKVKSTVDDWKSKEETAELMNSKNDCDEEDLPLLDVKTSDIVNSTSNPITTDVTSVDTDNSPIPETRTSNSDEIPFWSLPDKASTIDLFKLAGPIFITMMAKVLCYSLMTVRATNFGVIPLATHNIMTRVFFFFACFGDSLSQAAQSFYPQVAKQSRGQLIKRLFFLSSAVGVSNFQFSRLILERLGRFLSKDTSIIHMMAEYAPYVGYTVFLHPFIMLLEGTVLAKRDLVFMLGMYAATTLLHFGFVFSPFSATFGGLWRALFVFQFLRLVQFGFRVWDQSRKDAAHDQEISGSESTVST